jgi:sugar phosphate permease
LKPFDPNFPFAPAKLPFFYGWAIVAVGALGVLTSIPGQTMGVSVFTDDLLAATGLSRIALSNAYLVGTVGSGLILPWGGVLFDRFGARLLATLACWGLGATLCFLSVADRVSRSIAGALSLSETAVAAVVLCLAFTALRFSGQGMLTMVSRAMVSKWFDRRRGQVSGMLGVVINFGFSLAPAVIGAWIGLAGWRGAWLGMAAVVGLGMAAFAWLFFRDNPEECGLHMDGLARAATSAHEAPERERAYTRSQALRTLVFWVFAFGLANQSMVYTGITFHIVDLGAEHGLDRAQSVQLFIPIAVVSTSMGFFVGLAADRVRVQWLVMAMMVFQAIGFYGFAHLSDPWMRTVGVAGWGLSGGFFGPLTTVGIPKLFGRAHLGAISGALMSVLTIGSALGPSALAVSKGWLGGYGPGLIGLCALSACAFALAPFARTPAATGLSSERGDA